jgi:hypothetical protein
MHWQLLQIKRSSLFQAPVETQDDDGSTEDELEVDRVFLRKSDTVTDLANAERIRRAYQVSVL